MDTYLRGDSLDTVKLLIQEALESREKAYAPYSKFKVGAAILTSDNKIYGGFNIECAAFSPSNCAERTALFRAIYDGYRDFKAVAVVGGSDENTKVPLKALCTPCGVCRQMLREFCDPRTFKIISARDINTYETFTLEELLPYSFGPNNLIS